MPIGHGPGGRSETPRSQLSHPSRPRFLGIGQDPGPSPLSARVLPGSVCLGDARVCPPGASVLPEPPHPGQRPGTQHPCGSPCVRGGHGVGMGPVRPQAALPQALAASRFPAAPLRNP